MSDEKNLSATNFNRDSEGRFVPVPPKPSITASLVRLVRNWGQTRRNMRVQRRLFRAGFWQVEGWPIKFGSPEAAGRWAEQHGGKVRFVQGKPDAATKAAYKAGGAR